MSPEEPAPRRLSFGQVRQCESSDGPRCQCRCKGLMHGAHRSKLPEFFEQLPMTDPHWLKEVSRQLPLPLGRDRCASY